MRIDDVARPIVPFIREAEIMVRAPWSLAERRLLDYLLVYVEEGSCTLVVEGVRHELARGDFALVQPGERHSWEALVETNTQHAHLDVFYDPRREESFPTRPGQVDLSEYAALLQPRLNDLDGVHVPTRFRPRQAARFYAAMLRMVGLWQSDDFVDRLEAQTLATELIAHLLRDFAPHAGERRGAERFGWVTSYLSLRLAEPVSVSDMARRAGLSPSHFAAQFRRSFGMAPHRYLMQLRIEHAQSLLASSDASLSEIALLCGFADAPHFAKAFKRETGTTPSSYRRAQGEPVAA